MLFFRSAEDFLISLTNVFWEYADDGINCFISFLKPFSEIIEHQVDPEIGAVRYFKQPLLKMTFDIIS